jgi:predicted secreted protein
MTPPHRQLEFRSNRRAVLTGLAALAAMPAARAWGQDVIEVAFGKDTLRSVVVRRGTLVNVRLPAQPAAGYLWQLLATDQRIVTVVENRFEGARTTSSRGGDPADHLFVLRADMAGRVDLVFTYGLPWERNKPPERTATLRITVEG